MRGFPQGGAGIQPGELVKQLGVPELHPFELPPPFLCRSSWPTFCQYPDPGRKHQGFHREGCLDSARPPCEKAQQLQKWEFEIFTVSSKSSFSRRFVHFVTGPPGRCCCAARCQNHSSFHRPSIDFIISLRPSCPAGPNFWPRRAQFLIEGLVSSQAALRKTPQR